MNGIILFFWRTSYPNLRERVLIQTTFPMAVSVTCDDFYFSLFYIKGKQRRKWRATTVHGVAYLSRLVRM